MKVISLNTWGGRAGKEKLLEFFKKHQGETDVFCLQEIWAYAYEELNGRIAGGLEVDQSSIMIHGLQEISELLPDYRPFFRPHHLDNYGLLMLVKKDLPLIEEGEVFVYKHKGYIPEGDIGNHARNIQYVSLGTIENPITIINFHGLWNGKGKDDCDERIDQSKNILEFTTKLKGDFVICGDFNLAPDTESLKVLEDSGLRNLIKEYGIISTRTSFYTKPGKYADYILVSSGVGVRDFKVFPDEVSDHSPVYLEFN